MFSGYRRYKIERWSSDRLILEGAYAPWYKREFEAVCNRFTNFDRPITEQENCAAHLLGGTCTCGIYVLKQPNYIAGYREWPVLAEVSAWGAYIEFQSGWRVQHARIEHIWLDGFGTYGYVQELADRYKVAVDILSGCLFCQQDHEYAVWPASGGAISICKMETSHILNALNYLQKTARRDVSAAKWKLLFEKELKRRAPKLENGKMKVTI